MDDRYIDDWQPDEPPPEPPPADLVADEAMLALLDEALLPAALSAAIYSTSAWAFDLSEGANPMAWADNTSFAKRGELARALLINDACSPLSAADLSIDPEEHGATLVRGIWRKGLGSAAVVVEAREDGSKTLHLCVRGTDLNIHPNRVASAVQGLRYFLVYPDIEKHAAEFWPLVDAVQKFASNPDNLISRFTISGHSLGAAAAENIFRRLDDGLLPINMFGFGSPGTRFDNTVLARPVAAISCAVAPEIEGGEELPIEEVEMRVAQFIHQHDPVPKLGSGLYGTTGKVYLVMPLLEMERAHEMAEPPEEFSLGAHGSMVYANSLEELIEAGHQSVNPTAPLPRNLKRLTRAHLATLHLRSEALEDDIAKSRSAREEALRVFFKADPSDPSIPRLKSLPLLPDLNDKKALRSARGRRAVQNWSVIRAVNDRLPDGEGYSKPKPSEAPGQ